MTQNTTRMPGLRIVVEIGLLAGFGLLVFLGRIQLWLAVFAIGVILSLLFSRWYCGWACPMSTLFRPINWLYARLRLTRLKSPRFLQKPAARYLFVAALIGTMVLTKRMGLNLPLLVIVTGVAVLVTLVFEEAFWHNCICPYGTILHLAARPAGHSVKIDEAACIGCGKCQKVCPAAAIDTVEAKKRRIRKTDCLTCYTCVPECPKDAIAYQ